MQLKKSIATKGLVKSLKAFAGLFLVLAYLIGGNQFQGYHEYFHHHESEIHSAETEKDACHRAIYHKSLEGCSHSTHISKNNKCESCQHLNHTDHISILPSWLSFAKIQNSFDEVFSSVVVLEVVEHLPARAPPVI
jgi:hypothetical protein